MEFPTWISSLFDDSHVQQQQQHGNVFNVPEREKYLELCKNTTSQAGCALWHAERKTRITASRIHSIVHARESSTRKNYFFCSPPSNLPPFIYGNETEPVARKKYEQVTGNVVHQVGLMVKSNQSWLSASPDGLFLDAKTNEVSVLEVKCPFSSRDSRTLQVNYIDQRGKLKKNHSYYSQIQTQLYVAGCRVCHLFVYSPRDYKIVVVPIDHFFLSSIIHRSEHIYFSEFLPVIKMNGDSQRLQRLSQVEQI